MISGERLSTGVCGLDEHLGGGLLPGTLTVVMGATGIGKTQLGLQFAHAVDERERRGVVLDMTCRGDSQNHAAYAQRLFGWKLNEVDGHTPVAEDFFDRPAAGQYFHAFSYSGRRVSREDLPFEAWQQWQAEINRRVTQTIAFLYGHFVRGVRRVVVDGIEPVDRTRDSIQFYLFEYIYHQIIRKDAEWVARDLFREKYLAMQERVRAAQYDPHDIACLLLVTSHETMLEELIARPLEEGDILSNANTLIYMGKVRQGMRLGRALYIAKHRGSACSDTIIPFRITERGVVCGD